MSTPRQNDFRLPQEIHLVRHKQQLKGLLCSMKIHMSFSRYFKMTGILAGNCYFKTKFKKDDSNFYFLGHVGFLTVVSFNDGRNLLRVC